MLYTKLIVLNCDAFYIGMTRRFTRDYNKHETRQQSPVYKHDNSHQCTNMLENNHKINFLNFLANYYNMIGLLVKETLNKTEQLINP